MSNSMFSNDEIPFGTVIDSRYLIQKVLGQGGLGRTYLAFDTHRFNEPCVLKEFAPLGSGQYDIEKSRDLFKREAKILHQISHPQIPKFLACFEGKGRLFLVQEYVKGKTYSQLLQARQQQDQIFDETEVFRWLMNMLPILTYIHQRGIIHRDISPDNIMQPEGEELPVLIDFGVGKLMNLPYAEEGNEFNIRHNSFVGKMSFVGKIGYAPREQISMGRCSDSSDLYALGVTAVVLLTGKIPTILLDQYTLEWRWRKFAQVSQGMAQILDKMIEDKPMKRYQAAHEVIHDLQKLEQYREITPDLNSRATTNNRSSQVFAQPIASRPGVAKGKSQIARPSEDEEETVIVNTFLPSSPNSQSPHKSSQSFQKSTQRDNKQFVKPPTKNPIVNHQPDRSSQSIDDTMIVESLNSEQSKPQLNRQSEQNRSPQISSQSPQKQIAPPSLSPIKLTNSEDIPLANSKQQRIQQTPNSPIESPQILENQVLEETSLEASRNSVSRITHTRQNDIKSEFIQLCQQELAYCIGPMASLIVEEILVQYKPRSPEDLVDALAEQIPDMQKAIKFKRKLLS